MTTGRPMGNEPIPGFGNGLEPKRAPREWGIELISVEPGTPKHSVRVRLINRETGQHVGERTVPWSWFRDCGQTMISVNVAEGVWE